MVDLILVHGSPGTPRSWDPVVTELAADAQVHTVALPGHGAGENPAQGLSVADRALSVPAPPGATVLVGYSFGGVVAAAAASDPARRVDALVLLEPVLFEVLPEGSAAGSAARDSLLSYLEAARRSQAGAIGAMVDLWFGSGTYAAMDDRRHAYLEAGTAANVEDVAATMEHGGDLTALAARRIPTTVVLGTGSSSPLPEICAAVVDVLANAELTVIDGATHGMLETHPAQVAGVIDAAIAGVHAS